MNFSFLEAKAQRGGATVKCLDCEADMSVLGKWVIVAGRGGCTYMGACSTEYDNSHHRGLCNTAIPVTALLQDVSLCSALRWIAMRCGVAIGYVNCNGFYRRSVRCLYCTNRILPDPSRIR